ncbi:hypothetical protein CROQUDRAFT_46100 [Cronartium quercuum f. sp. fusiforme G11]|uniref:Transcription factor IIIC subunit 5 HTH domain-containing protein n=1 Tax=Cronartium quercuum f. sp. fusiforme G11 TaxID=708437 RepID=A0A9P6NGN6_9BASI|nr:hypothetical protein CROQUDRAFT_46100 [Cronartium quercuum f. sp. fusiforme G11]
MADFQYIPDAQHPISKLANDMKHLNPEGVLNFRFKPETEDYSPSQIGLFPPPIFSRYVVPQIYQYKHHSASVLSKTSAGTERLVNKARYTCSTPQSITFENPNVPQAALPSHLKMKRPEDEALYQKALSLFEQRPIWARLAFQNQLTPTELRALRYNKHLLAYTCYMFSDGAFRDLLVKFGYDPRVDSNARFYQRISIRNLDNKKLAEKFTFKLMRHPFSKDTDHSTGQNDSNRRSHVFDGLELNQSVGTYQLCDITDPLLKRLIESPKGVQEQCRIRDGWYTSNAIEQIRSILRRKFHGLLDNGRKVTDLECVDLLEIDVSCDAAGLLKRPKSVGERRFGGKNVGFDPLAGQVVLDGDSDSDNGLGRREAGETRSERRVGAHALGPNPLLRTRRAKSRAKAKKRTGPLERDAIDEENEEEMDRDGIASSQLDLNDLSREPGKGPEASSSSLSEAQRGETGGGEMEVMMKAVSIDEDEEEEEEEEESEEFEGYEDEDDSLTELGEEHDEEDLMIGCEGSSGSEEEEEEEESD